MLSPEIHANIKIYWYRIKKKSYFDIRVVYFSHVFLPLLCSVQLTYYKPYRPNFCFTLK